MHVLIGTSGFSYTAWRGAFYPEKLPEAKMLAYYATQLATVEINNSFYRMPTADVLGRWAAETPAGFRFAIKSPKRITHDQRLRDVASSVAQLAEATRALGDKLGPVLFQLPPNFKKDLPRLDEFLGSLPAGVLPAVEFRHESWLTDDTFERLTARRAALCVAETDEGATPLRSTAGWGYLRLRKETYDEAAIAAWADRIRQQSWDTAYVFFKHEDAGKGPAAATKLKHLLT
jgi:uncharacterized protein YecE (DUF72 family)